MEFKLKYGYFKKCELGDFIVCKDELYRMIKDEDGLFSFLDLKDNTCYCKYKNENIAMREFFGSNKYRVIKNENMTLVEN